MSISIEMLKADCAFHGGLLRTILRSNAISRDTLLTRYLATGQSKCHKRHTIRNTHLDLW
jgi:hypothetical protein